jgi:uncharacterized protein
MFRSSISRRTLSWTLLVIILGAALQTTACGPRESDVKGRYIKQEVQIPMRDGVNLYAAVYVPRDSSESYPFLIKKSPYSSGPYGADNYPNQLGPNGSDRFEEEGYIFVYEDVRGRFMSEGQFLNMTPHIDEKGDSTDVDESSDMFDTVEWLLENIQPNNGRAGIWGISYPGFYAAASAIDSHPALKAASPQAPISDWFVGDDFHHNGAFYLQDAFRFFSFFESPDPNPTDHWNGRFDFPTDDGYQFFLDMGPLRNANEMYFNGTIAFWDSLMQHGNYDEFWQRRNINPHMKGVTANVMTVGGFFDAEDPYGPTHVYKSIEEKNPGINNTLVMGPWFHGGWVRGDGDHLGNVSFENKTSVFYQENIDLSFFNYYLKDKGQLNLPEVYAYSTGSNEWHRLASWPPEQTERQAIYLRRDYGISMDPPVELGDEFDEYVSDPSNPVPYTKEVTVVRTREYIVEDQRFVADREDVLVYQSDILTEDLTIAGPVTPHLYVSTTGTDADYVVKLIDVFPDDEPEWQKPSDKYLPDSLAGYQMLVRGDVMRAKFRNSYEKPDPLVPNEITEITFDAPDAFHTFRKGHRIMVQIQSSWFPLVDRNPQQFVDIYQAAEDDFQSATQRIYRSADYPSYVEVGVVSE